MALDEVPHDVAGAQFDDAGRRRPVQPARRHRRERGHRRDDVAAPDLEQVFGVRGVPVDQPPAALRQGLPDRELPAGTEVARRVAAVQGRVVHAAHDDRHAADADQVADQEGEVAGGGVDEVLLHAVERRLAVLEQRRHPAPRRQFVEKGAGGGVRVRRRRGGRADEFTGESGSDDDGNDQREKPSSGSVGPGRFRSAGHGGQSVLARPESRIAQGGWPVNQSRDGPGASYPAGECEPA